MPQYKQNHNIKTQAYTFQTVIEADEDQWLAYCHALKNQGASTCGRTQKEALKNIKEVVEMIVEELIEDGKKVPREEIKLFSNIEIRVPVLQNAI